MRLNYSIGYVILFIIFISYFMPAHTQEIQKKPDEKNACFCLSHPETKNILFFDCSETKFPNKYTPKVICKKCGPKRVTNEIIKDANKFNRIAGADTGLCAPCQQPEKHCKIILKDGQRNGAK